jgi:hypothetical protein
MRRIQFRIYCGINIIDNTQKYNLSRSNIESIKPNTNNDDFFC